MLSVCFGLGKEEGGERCQAPSNPNAGSKSCMTNKGRRGKPWRPSKRTVCDLFAAKTTSSEGGTQDAEQCWKTSWKVVEGSARAARLLLGDWNPDWNSMALTRASCFNVPGIFSPHRLTIRYPPEDKSTQEESSAVQVGEKRKEPEIQFLEEEVALNALELATESEVFEKLFTSELGGTEHPSITVESFEEKDSLLELLRFCYTKKLTRELLADKEGLIRLLILADRYAVANALPVISTALKKNAKLGDACRILNLPDHLRELGALRPAVEFSQDLIRSEMLNLDEAYKMGKYEGLPAEGLRLVLANPASKVECEHTVFVLVWKWLKGGAGREREFKTLSKLIRYHHMTSSFLCLIQQLPETQDPEVALQIRKALLIAGVQILHNNRLMLVSRLARRDGNEVVAHPRPGAKPLQRWFGWGVDEDTIRSLKEQQRLSLGKREVFGYNMRFHLFKLSKNLVLELELSSSYSGSDLDPTLPTALETFVQTTINKGSENYSCSTKKLQLGMHKLLKWGGEDGKELLAENFNNHKLTFRVSVTFI